MAHQKPNKSSSIFGPRPGRRRHRPAPPPEPGTEPGEFSEPQPVPIAGRPLPPVEDSIALLERHKQGDAEALQLLIERYQDRLRRIVRIKLAGRVRNYLESMDIVQDVNMVMMRKAKDLKADGSGAILNWLSEVVVNKIRNTNKYMHAIKRDVGRNVAFEVQLEDGVTTLSIPAEAKGPTPSEEAWKFEVREVLDDAMTELSDQHREVILLRDYAGASLDYVAQRLGCPSREAADQLHRRAWVKLRRIARPRLGDIQRED